VENDITYYFITCCDIVHLPISSIIKRGVKLLAVGEDKNYKRNY